ncbi:MAG: tetratricopeptide repeat protein [Elusimicrobiota bacterium]
MAADLILLLALLAPAQPGLAQPFADARSVSAQDRVASASRPAKRLVPSLRSADQLVASGRQAYEQGEFRRSLECMVEALLYNPHDPKARSYLEASARRLRDSRLRSMEEARSETLDDRSSALEQARVRAERWQAELAAAAQAEGRGEWIVACDRYLGVLEDNPKHGDARIGLNWVQREVAMRLDRRDFHDVKEGLLYKAFFHHLQRQDAQALKEFKAALEYPHLFAALSDWEIRAYVDKLSPKAAEPEETAKTAPTPLPRRKPSFLRIAKRTVAPAQTEEPGPVGRRADYLFKRAIDLQSRKDFAEAVRTFAELLALEPDYPGAREAAFLASQELNRERTTLKVEAEKHYQTGLAYYAGGKLQEARAEWEKAVIMDPGHSYALRALGRIQLDLREGQP